MSPTSHGTLRSEHALEQRFAHRVLFQERRPFVLTRVARRSVFLTLAPRSVSFIEHTGFFFASCASKPLSGTGHCKTKKSKAKRDPSCTRWVKRRPSELRAGHRRLAERNAAPGRGAKKQARTWVANVRQLAACRVWSGRDACPQRMQPLLQSTRKRPAEHTGRQESRPSRLC